VLCQAGRGTATTIRVAGPSQQPASRWRQARTMRPRWSPLWPRVLIAVLVLLGVVTTFAPENLQQRWSSGIKTFRTKGSAATQEIVRGVPLLHEPAFAGARNVTPRAIGTLLLVVVEQPAPVEAEPGGLIVRFPGGAAGVASTDRSAPGGGWAVGESIVRTSALPCSDERQGYRRAAWNGASV
jgi:hypothetical protein